MVILFMFNEADEISYSDIMKATEIQPLKELKRHALSLIRMRILTKTTKEFDLNPEDMVSINEDFKSKLLKFKVPLLNPKENSNTQIENRLNDDRRHLLEATIVRILKSRKSINHNELMSEVINILNELFQPSP